jgi:hypothetical protein
MFSTRGKLVLGSYFLIKMAESGSKKTEKRDESELDMPIWSVVSFDRCEASGLTYSEAAQKLAELDSQKVSGLCIITDEAASRVDA